MKKIISLTLLFTGILLADNAASNTASAQRWPWNGKVDINYTLTATTTKTSPVFSVKFFGQDPSGNKFSLTSLSGDGTTGITLGAGPKKATWDATADLGTDVDTTGYKIGVYAEDVTEEATYLVLDLTTYQMQTSTNGPSVAVGASSKYAELWLRRTENGTFLMGSNLNEPGHLHGYENEHLVTLTKAYYIGVFELTEGQFARISDNISTSAFSVLPMWYISYNSLRGTGYGAKWPEKNDHRVDAASFFGKLRAKTGNGLVFDLPTDAQWEAAARWKGTTGNGTNDYYGSSYWNNGKKFTDSSYDGIDDVAWYLSNADNKRKEVGLKEPSTIGTYDMHGNVWEWCLDWWTGSMPTTHVVDPEGPESGNTRVSHGGGVHYGASFNRIAYRYAEWPTAPTFFGCRVVLVP